MKNIFLICDNYPISDGEYFLDDEINCISEKVEKIYVLTTSTENKKIRKTPDNVFRLSIENLSKLIKFQLLVKSLFCIDFWKDYYNAKKTFGVKRDFQLFKIILSDLLDANHLKKQILIICKKNSIDLKQTVFYSYWHDKKALALALIKSEFSDLKAVARGHGWDVDFSRHSIPFLPFKKYIISQLDLSISISGFGKNQLEKVSDIKDKNKIIVSRLGKSNDRIPVFEKKQMSNKITICSCSSLIPLKRVDLILEFVSKLQEGMEIQWIHFGDGDLRIEIEEKAKQKKVELNLMGNVENSKILDFYSENYVDLFINFSEFEGVPVSIMEAQSAGIPVLATKVGGTTEIVSSENGFLVEKYFDLSESVKQINLFLNSSNESIVQKRKFAYLSWKESYRAEKNYTDFLISIQSLMK